jgi:hypothetical protein
MNVNANNCQTIFEKAQHIPVLINTDVAVAGAGPAGVVAAVAAARQGVKVVLIERFGSLGGNLTIGLSTKPSGTLLGGIPKEIWEKARSIGAAGPDIKGKIPSGEIFLTSPCDPELMKIILIRMCIESGVEILFECHVVAPIVEENMLKGLIIEGKGGRQAICGKVIIDATADADVAAAAGVPFQIGSQEGKMQPVSLLFKMNNVDVKKLFQWAREHPEDLTERYISDGSMSYGLWISGFSKLLREFQMRKGIKLPRENITLKTGYGNLEIYVNATRVKEISGLSVLDISKSIMECYQQIETYAQFLHDYIPGFENSYINAISPMLGVRETRHIIGEYYLTSEDVLKGTHFWDSIAVDNSPLDIHDVSGSLLRFEGGRPYEIPYRCLVPQKIEQLLLAGRCISVDHIAYGRARNMPACMSTGQAAGIAAAIAIKDSTKARKIEVIKLQEQLHRIGMPTHLAQLD